MKDSSKRSLGARTCIPKYPFEKVIFDFDGTLHASEDAARSAANEILRHHRLPEVLEEEYRKRLLNDWKWYRDRGVCSSDDELRALFWKHYNDASCGLGAHALSVLCNLQDRGIPCSIVSAHHSEKLQEKLLHFDIAQYFTHVTGGVSPKAEAIKEICGRDGWETSQVIYVGDLASDAIDALVAQVGAVIIAPPNYPFVHDGVVRIDCISQLPGLIAWPRTDVTTNDVDR